MHKVNKDYHMYTAEHNINKFVHCEKSLEIFGGENLYFSHKVIKMSKNTHFEKIWGKIQIFTEKIPMIYSSAKIRTHRSHIK